MSSPGWGRDQAKDVAEQVSSGQVVEDIGRHIGELGLCV